MRIYHSSLFIAVSRSVFARKQHQLVRKIRYNFLAGYRLLLFFVVFFDESRGTWFYQLEGTKNKVSQSVSEPQSLSSEDLLDDNSLQLRVVNGGKASWFLHNLWRLVNHPIIPAPPYHCLVRLLALRPLPFSLSSSPSPSPLTLPFLRDTICFHATRGTAFYGLIQDTINCYKNISVQVSKTKDCWKYISVPPNKSLCDIVTLYVYKMYLTHT